MDFIHIKIGRFFYKFLESAYPGDFTLGQVYLLCKKYFPGSRSASDGVACYFAGELFKLEKLGWVAVIRERGGLGIVFRINQIPDELKLEFVSDSEEFGVDLGGYKNPEGDSDMSDVCVSSDSDEVYLTYKLMESVYFDLIEVAAEEECYVAFDDELPGLDRNEVNLFDVRRRKSALKGKFKALMEISKGVLPPEKIQTFVF